MNRRDYLQYSTLAGMANLWNSESADLASHPSRSPQDATRHVFNVRASEFSARGDGAADDTAAIQQAIDTAGRLGSGTVFIPPGRYLVTGLKLRSGVTVAGAGMTLGDQLGSGTIVQAATPRVPAVFDVGGTQYAGVRNLKIVGSSPAIRNRIVGIDCSDPSTYLHIFMVSIRYCGGTAVRSCGSVNRIEYVRTRNCWGHIIEQAAHDSHVMFCDIGSTDRRSKSGIVVSGDQCAIIGNNVFNCRSGIHLDWGNRTRVLGNRCEKNGYYGIEVNSHENNIVSNQCWNNGVEAMAAETVSAGILVINRNSNTMVANCLFNLPNADDSVQDVGVLLIGTDDAPASHNVVAGNTVRECHRGGIKLTGHTRSTMVSSNAIVVEPDGELAVGIEVLGQGRNNHVIANCITRLGGRVGLFAGIYVDQGCRDTVLADNVVTGVNHESHIIDLGVRSRINGMVTSSADVRDLTRELEPGRLVYDHGRRVVYLTTGTDPIQLA